jgi:hypothetical protein
VQAALAMRQAVPPPSAADGHAPVSVGIHVAPCLVALGGDPMGMAPADRRAAWTADGACGTLRDRAERDGGPACRTALRAQEGSRRGRVPWCRLLPSPAGVDPRR